MPEYRVKVNGTVHTIEADPDMPLLYALRDDLEAVQSAFRLRAVAMRRLHGASGRRGDALLRDADVARPRATRSTTLQGLGTPEQAASAADRLCRRAGACNAAIASTAG